MTDDPASVDVSALVDRVERSLLGGERRYTRVEMVGESGVPHEDVRALWRAMGFATIDDDDERAFTELDLAALKSVRQLSEQLGIQPDVMLAMTRMIGQSFARLASWQGQVIVDAVANSPKLLDDTSGDSVVDLVDRITPITASLHEYVWRRQLDDYFRRVTSGNAGNVRTMAVGFADMAQFTTLTRRSSEAELRQVLAEFETVTTDVVSRHSGQIVKTIGDEVLFVASEPSDGAEIALELLTAAGTSDVLPSLRVGLAAGPVVSRLGDVFGQTVNIASRLTSLARMDSALVDQGMHDALADDDRYRLGPLRPVSVRGYQHLRSWRLRHRQAA